MNENVYYCEECKKEASNFLHLDGRIMIECHGGLQVVALSNLVPAEPYPVERGMTTEQKERFGRQRMIRCFRDGEPDLFRGIRSVMRFLNLPTPVIITTMRLAKMEEKELTAEFIRQGNPDGFNYGCHVEIHPWIPNVRIFYQEENLVSDSAWYSRAGRNVAYREKIDQIKYGRTDIWPQKFSMYFPKPTDSMMKDFAGLT